MTLQTPSDAVAPEQVAVASPAPSDPSHALVGEPTDFPAPARLASAGILVLLFVPALAFVGLIGGFQLFLQPGWVDAGIYLGHFLNFDQLIGRFGPTYFAMRLGFTLTGYSLHQVFSPRIAYLVLIFSFYCVALASMFVILRPRFGATAGLIGAFGLGFNPVFVAAITNNYVDGAGVSMALAALACIWSVRFAARKRALLFCAGAAAVFGSNIHPVVATILFLPMALTGADLLRRRTISFADAAFLVAGALGTQLAFSLVAVAMNMPFRYFLDIVEVSPIYLNVGTRFQRPVGEWLPQSYRLHLVPFALLVSLAAWLASPRAAADKRFLPWLMIFLVGQTTAMAIFDFVHGGALLQSPFYGSYLLIPVSLCLGASCGLALDRASRWLGVGAPIGVAAVMTLVVLAEPWIADLVGARADLFAIAVALGTGIVLAAVAFARGWRPARSAVAMVIYALVAALGTANPDTARAFVRTAGVDFGSFYNVSVEFVRFVERADLRDRRLLFWFDRDRFTLQDARRDLSSSYADTYLGQRRQFSFFDTLNALYLWDRSQIRSRLPNLSADELEILRFSSLPVTVVVLGMLAEDGDLATVTLNNYGLNARVRAMTVIRDGPVRIRAWLYDVSLD